MTLANVLHNQGLRTTARRSVKAGGWLVIGIAAICILAALVLVTVPRLMGWQGIVVLTGSMEPELKTGDLFFIEGNVDPQSLRAGDIITFDRGQSTVTHRIIGFGQGDGERRFVTKGDANGLPDQEFVAAEQIHGKVVLSLPYVGAWSRWLRQQNNFQLLLWPVAGLIVLIEARNIYGQVRRNREALHAE